MEPDIGPQPNRLYEIASPFAVAAVGVAILLCGYGTYSRIRQRTAALQSGLKNLEQTQLQGAQALNHFQSLADLKAQDVDQFKSGMSSQAQLKKALYESGLSLQEEKRLLEKQWEIM